jgi:hypothetical protein
MCLARKVSGTFSVSFEALRGVRQLNGAPEGSAKLCTTGASVAKTSIVRSIVSVIKQFDL